MLKDLPIRTHWLIVVVYTNNDINILIANRNSDRLNDFRSNIILFTEHLSDISSDNV